MPVHSAITADPQYLIDTGDAYCDGSEWVNGSSREYKQNIHDLTADEAMSIGKPVLCSNTGSMQEIAGDAALSLTRRGRAKWLIVLTDLSGIHR